MGSDSAFVPSTPWVFHSPDVKRVGRQADLGLVAEALIFYDRVYFAHSSDKQYAALVSWFKGQGRINELIALISDGVLVPYYYAFHTNACEFPSGTWDLINIVETGWDERRVFAENVAQSSRLNSIVRKKTVRAALESAAIDNHVEVKTADFGSTILQAKADFADPDRVAFILQLIYDELYEDLGYLRPPVVQVTGDRSPSGEITITSNRDFSEFLQLGLKVTPGTSLAAAGFGVKTLWSAALMGCDIYVGAPLLDYLASKLDEGGRGSRSRAIMQDLVARADFPDIRRLVNNNSLGIDVVLKLRKRGARFRRWLREESELDRDALAAYLGEFADASGWKSGLGKAIRIIGVVGGRAVTALTLPAVGPIAAPVAGVGVTYVANLAAKLDTGWSPRVFGQAVRAEVARR